MFFNYGDEETEYLKSRDKRLGAVIDALGHIDREVDPDVFSSVVHHIIGQQISQRAMESVWGRVTALLYNVNAENTLSAGIDGLRSCGLSARKAEYIMDFAAKVKSGEFDVNALHSMPDYEAEAALVSLKGVGIWTAKMILLFCLERRDILSFGDFGIRRGLRMVYHHREITKVLFEKYRRRYSPYGSIASLYLWAVAGGKLPGMKDYAPQKAQRLKRAKKPRTTGDKP